MMHKIGVLCCIAAFLLLLSGCSQQVHVQNDRLVMQSNLLQPCTADTPIPISYKLNTAGQPVYNGADMIRTLIEWQNVYDLCSTRMDNLIDAVKSAQKDRTIPLK